VVYLHGNSSSRLEAITVLPTLLPRGITVFAFDFAGSGISEGDHVSLGYYEKDDVKRVIDYLYSTGKVTCVGLWGRSMGAATALMHTSRDQERVKAIVCDSPFSCLRSLSGEFTNSYLNMQAPTWLVGMLFEWVRSVIKDRNKFDIMELKPIQFAATTFVPALFMAAKDDKFVLPHHAHQIYEAYGGKKRFEFVEGDHNSYRPQHWHCTVADFFLENLFGSGHCPKQPFGCISSNTPPLVTQRCKTHEFPRTPPQKENVKPELVTQRCKTHEIPRTPPQKENVKPELRATPTWARTP
jgi:pimeloyl-ACP methyl ester carboxylesterase